MSGLIGIEVYFDKPKITFRYSDGIEKRIDYNTLVMDKKPEAEHAVTSAAIKAKGKYIVESMKEKIDSTTLDGVQKEELKKRLSTSESKKKIEARARAALVDEKARELAKDGIVKMVADLRAAAIKIGG